MNIQNYEFKAKVKETATFEEKLLALYPDYKGLDHQVDTYFNVPKGRLKLREGTIENALISYQRENTADSKLSTVILYKHQPDPALKAILTDQFGVKIIVDKKRKIYFIGNIKFHFDTVDQLGHFIEVEAIDNSGNIPVDDLKKQCDHYKTFFAIRDEDMMAESYSDMMIGKGMNTGTPA